MIDNFQGGGIELTFINAITTVICCIVVITVLFYNTCLDVHGENQNYKSGKWILISLIGLLLITRMVEFGKVPGGYCCDTVLAAVNAKSLMECGVDFYGVHYPVLFGVYGYGVMSVLMSYAMIPFIKLWGLNLVTVTLPILLASILGAMAVYGFVKDTFGTKVAYVTLLLLVINPWHFMQGRWALDCNMLPHLFWGGCFCLIDIVSEVSQHIFMLQWLSFLCVCIHMDYRLFQFRFLCV